MKAVFRTFLFAFLFFTAAQAGSQRITKMDHQSYHLSGHTLVVSGQANGKNIAGEVHRFRIEGQVRGISCQGIHNPCFGVLSFSDDNLLLTIEIDQDQDGNIEIQVPNLPIGKRDSYGQVHISAPTKSYFVEERYSFFEKLKGLKDRDFVAVTIELNIL